MRRGRATGIHRRSYALRGQMAVDRTLRTRIETRAGQRVRDEDCRGAERAESAASVFLSRDAGEQFRSVRNWLADAMGYRERHVAVHSWYRQGLRAQNRTSCRA